MIHKGSVRINHCSHQLREEAKLELLETIRSSSKRNSKALEFEVEVVEVVEVAESVEAAQAV